jgi:hypothetical protein
LQAEEAVAVPPRASDFPGDAGERFVLAALPVETVLQNGYRTIDEKQQLPLREYDLSMLAQPFDFPTDPADGIAGVMVKELRLMDLGDDCGLVLHGDKILTFGGDKQRLLLQIMFAAYWSGSPGLRVAAVLEEAGYGGQVNSLKKAFGRRENWQAFIKFDDGNCWIDP